MKSIAEKGEKIIKSKPATFKNTRNYYFHPDEDFKEDYEWEKTRSLSKTTPAHTGKIVLR